MKNKLYLLAILSILIIFSTIYFYFSRDSISLSYTNHELYLKLSQGNTDEIIYPFFEETSKCYIFFLPSYAENEKILLDKNMQNCLFPNDGVISSRYLSYNEDLIYNFSPSDATTENYSIKFLCSQNIPSVFLSLEDEFFHYILDENHDNFAQANINIINSFGKTEYYGQLDSFSGHGNSTWQYAKKPFTIKSNKSVSLCGLAPSSKWVLLANWRDATKINNKLSYDIANILNLKFTPDATWVDLYINGDYYGNYLLSTPVNVSNDNLNIHNLEKENVALNPNIEQATTFEQNTIKGYNIKNNPNVTGGYLLEKDFEAYYASEPNGFITNEGFSFTLKHPKHASLEQVEYISDYVQKIENMILTQDKNLPKYLDFDSYSKRHLIDEISTNFDAGVTSMYFYKDINDPLLYSGPVWDYDFAYGIFTSSNHNIITTSILDRGITWNKLLLDNPVFFQTLTNNFKQALPELERLISCEIEKYCNYISKSVSMDKVRWQKYGDLGYIDHYYHGHYQSFEGNVEFLKYFLINRINYLISLWEIDYPNLNFNFPLQFYTVTFMDGDTIIHQQKAQHGEIITDLPKLPSTVHSNWYRLPREELHTEYLPILEDTILIAK